ncbi:TPA: hypothetical protein ACH3X1_015590 [Trebouxia sp. C0004]
MLKKSAQLFDGNDEVINVDSPQLKVNDDFARRLQHNKQREELHRLQERHPKEAAKAAQLVSAQQPSEGGEESSEEDEDDGYIPNAMEKQIFETMLKIRKRDSSIYDSKKHFFADTSDDDQPRQNGRATKKSKASKPMLLKDVIAQQALEHGAEAADSDEEEAGPAEPTYVQEQQDLKRNFLQAVEEEDKQDSGDEFGGGVLHKRQRAAAQDQQSDGEAADLQQSLDEYFGTDAPLNEDDKFLRQYVLNKGWVDADEAGLPSYQEIVGVHDDEDEAYGEQADHFEAAYNFRFEEEGGRQMVTHPRILENTVRKTDDRRKRKRAEKAQRKAAQESIQQQEVKRLKNLKGRQIQERLQRIRDIAGPSGQDDAALDALMQGDFDPEQYDKQMAAAFGDEYYGDEDDGPGDILDDELQRQLNEMADYDSANEEDPAEAASHPAEEPEAEESEEDAGAAAAALALERNAVNKLLAEYDKLDYEDDIGGLKTRFHYRTVAKEDYGLSTDEILRLKDKELNQLVGLKQMAPYREERGKFRPNYGKMKELQIGQEQKQAKWQQRQQQRQEQKARSKQKSRSAPAADALVTAQAPAADGLPAEKAPADAKAQRMKSFQKLTLKRSKPSGSSHGLTGVTKKKAAPALVSQPESAAAGLSKAARKNMKRAAKRASKRAQKGLK